MDASSPAEIDVAALRDRVRGLAEREHPTTQDVDYLVEHADALTRNGLAEEAAQILSQWLETGHDDPDIRMAQVMLTASVPSASAAHRRRSYESATPQDAALEIVHCAFRGELQRAIDIAEHHDWFTDAPTEIEGLSYALFGLILEGRYEQAETIIDEWKLRHAAEIPSCYQMLLRFEARVAAYQHQYARELSLMEQACALCEEQGHAATLGFTEPDLAIALARNGDIDRARALIESWTPAPGAGPLNGMRNGAILDVELLAGDLDAAYRAGRKALGTPPARIAPVHCRFQFSIVLAAPADRFAAELSELERVVHRYPIRHFADRLRWLRRVLPPDTPARHIKLRLVSTHSARDVGLERLWTPAPECTRADLYWDGIRGVAMLAGRGPYSLERHPVLARLMTTLIDSPGFALDLPTAFETTWGQTYDPLKHEGKVHVTIHRLRSWFAAHGHRGEPLLTLREGQLALDPSAHVWALTEPTRGAAPRVEDASDVDARLVAFLQEHGAVPPREIAQRLSLSRTRLTQILNRLCDAGRIQRSGRGRAVVYTASNDGAT